MKKFKNLALATLIAGLSVAAAPQKAEAYALISGINQGYVMDFTGSRSLNFLLCALFLPVCVLDGQQVSSPSVEATLSAQGVSPETARNIGEAIAQLKSKKLAVISKEPSVLTAEELVDALVEVGISEDRARALVDLLESVKG